MLGEESSGKKRKQSSEDVPDYILKMKPGISDALDGRGLSLLEVWAKFERVKNYDSFVSAVH